MRWEGSGEVEMLSGSGEFGIFGWVVRTVYYFLIITF